MYVAAGVMGLISLLLGFLSRKEVVDSRVSKLLSPFYRMALYLYKKACIFNVPFLSNRQVEKDLAKLHPNEGKKQLCTEYYVGKIAKSLMICLAGTFLGLVISMQSRNNRLLSDEGLITRGSYEDGTQNIEVECTLPEGTQGFTVEVGAKVFDEEEIKQLCESFRMELPDLILGENASLQEVSEKLHLQEAYEGYPFAVDWESDKPDVVGSSGTVNGNIEEAQEIELHATIAYGEWEWEEKLFVQAIPPNLSREEIVHRELEKLLLASERDSRMNAEWKLPDSWQGQELLWTEKLKDNGAILWIGAVLVAFLIYLLADKDLHDEVEKRKQRMRRDYPDIVHKLVLYLGAGMTIRGAFQRVAEEHEQTRAGDKLQYPVYEEMLYTCRELKAGTSEGTAYEHFGKRTGLQEYIRLSTLLTQNLKKGNSTLLQRLREEATKASAERIQYGKRLAEEAVTKLLLPMVMMLLVVMLMIMIPAFSSVGT